MLRIVMDSAGDLPEEWIKEYQIEIIPINVHMGNEVFLEDVDLSIDQFYDWVKETGEVPKTSQPTPHQFINFYQGFAQPGDVILSIHLTSKLSGTYESAVLAAKELEDEPYRIIPSDTLAGTGIQGYMCRKAREMDRQGADPDQILKRLEQIRKGTEVIFTVDNLEFAQKSGRVKMLESILASILKIKPIITLSEGTLAVADKVRTRKKSLDFILQEMSRRMEGNIINAAIIHANDLATALEISERIEGILNIKDIFVEELSVAIATHLDPGAVGIVAYPVEEGIISMRTNKNLPKELLRVESQLKEILQPVQPRSGFVEELRIQLEEEMVQKMKSKKVKTGLIVAGGIVGVAVMVITLIRSIMTWPSVVHSITEKFRKREQAVSV